MNEGSCGVAAWRFPMEGGHAGDIASLFAVESLARRIDQGDQQRAGLLQSPPLGFDSILKHDRRIGTVLPALSARRLCDSHDSAPHTCRVVVRPWPVLIAPAAAACAVAVNERGHFRGYF